MDFLIERIIVSARRINSRLRDHVRSTGIMQSKAVTRNYLRFADWLNFLQIEQRLVVPSGFTVFFAQIEKPEDFALTDKEKMAFLLHLSKIGTLVDLLCSLKMKNTMREYTREDLSEHFVETYFEWFADLGILVPTSQRFGAFELSNRGYHVAESCRSQPRPRGFLEEYARRLLDSPLRNSAELQDGEVWRLFEEAVGKLAPYAVSEVDPDLYSALPLVLDLQLNLIFERHILVDLEKLTQKLKDISWQYNAVFDWDPLANVGYVKMKR